MLTFSWDELDTVFQKAGEIWEPEETAFVHWVTAAVTTSEKGDENIKNDVNDLTTTYDICLGVMVSDNHRAMEDNIHKVFPASITLHS